MGIERTLIIFKPDALQRGLVGRILGRFEDKGFKIVGMKFMQVAEKLAQEHYSEHKDKPFYGRLVNFITASPVIAMCLEAPKCVELARKMLGRTFGFEAEPGTVRGDFSLSKSYNLIHASDSLESAKREIALFFNDEEVVSWKPLIEDWRFLDEDVE